MGMTGVGKSSFIKLFAQEDVPIGTDLESCVYLPKTINSDSCSLLIDNKAPKSANYTIVHYLEATKPFG